MTPLLREGRTADAFLAGLDAIDALLTGKGFAARRTRAARNVLPDALLRGEAPMIAHRSRGAVALAAARRALLARAADVPYLTGRVVDNAEILSAGDARRSSRPISRRTRTRTTNQIAVLTVKSLDGESVEDFAVRVFEAWKLGQKGKDNGVLVVVAPTDRRMRIEVGYGLEGTLTDAAAARIIRDRMTPRFKANDLRRRRRAGRCGDRRDARGQRGARRPSAGRRRRSRGS